MTAATRTHPESYDDFQVGDDVFCLAWIGKPFRVVGKDDANQIVQIDGEGPCSLEEGIHIDVGPEQLFLLTHNLWDHIWDWPDREGEDYQTVVGRFIAKHEDGQIVTGYADHPFMDFYFASNNAKGAMSFRLSFAALEAINQVHAQPVAADNPDGDGFLTVYDPAIPDEKWHPVGPGMALRIEMFTYRWAVMYGRLILNNYDFARPA